LEKFLSQGEGIFSWKIDTLPMPLQRLLDSQFILDRKSELIHPFKSSPLVRHIDQLVKSSRMLVGVMLVEIKGVFCFQLGALGNPFYIIKRANPVNTDELKKIIT